MPFFRTVFHQKKSPCCHQGNEGSEAQALERRRLLYFQDVSLENSGRVLPEQLLDREVSEAKRDQRVGQRRSRCGG